MTIYKGSTKLETIYHGGTKIGKGYKGSTLVYQDKIEEILTINSYYGGYTFPSTSVGSYWNNEILSGVFQTITGGIGNAGSSIYAVWSYGSTSNSKTLTFSKEVSLKGYKYFEYIGGNAYAYISPKQIINDNIVLSFDEPITTYIITDVSGSTVTVNGNLTKDISYHFYTENITYRA